MGSKSPNDDRRSDRLRADDQRRKSASARTGHDIALTRSTDELVLVVVYDESDELPELRDVESDETEAGGY